MNHSDIAALMKGAAPAIRDFVAAALRPLVERIAGVEHEVAVLRATDVAALARVAAAEAAAVPKDRAPGRDGAPGERGPEGPPGKDGRDGIDGRDGVDGKDGAPGEQGPAGPPGRDGADGRDGVNGADGAPGPEGPAGRDGVDGQPGERGADGQPGERGADGLPGRDGVDGKDGGPGPQGERGEKGDPGEDGPPGRDGADGAPGERGPEGPPGKLPVVQAWEEGVSYEGDVRSHAGALWQAVRDTGREPPHADWICLANRGADGRDGRPLAVLGTWSAAGTYAELDVVALNGSSFVALRDDPGPCPGEGWQLIASRGKSGPPGERGPKGEKGERGPAGVVTALEIDDQGMLTLRNGDGSIVTCDLYPLLSRLDGR